MRRLARASSRLSPLAALLLPACADAPAAPPDMGTRPVHTFSIVARDAATGELGVAVQSHWFGVGSLVPWAEAGVGAVATQSFVNPSFGPRGLALLRAGRSPSDALAELVASDEGRDVRQVALVDAHGRAAAHTGERCIAWAGHQVGDGYSVQANIMVDGKVVPAMAAAFEAAEGPLAARLLAALEAGQAAGGDLRGRQSAALLVVAAEPSGEPWRDRRVDLRVDDHPRPIAELRRLYDVHRAYESMNAGDAALEKADVEGALAAYGAAMELQPGNVEMVFWTAFALANGGELERALPLFRRAFDPATGPEAGERWRELLRRLPAAGLVEEELVRDVLARTEPGRGE